MVTNEQIIEAYKKTGSVWKAGKEVGLSGQTVHERLRSIGYKLAASKWTEEELQELEKLANQMTIAQIANRLGRPYNGVAMKLSRLGFGDRFGNKQKKKIPRTGQYTKPKITEYIEEIDTREVKVTKFAKENSLATENLVAAIQRLYPDWYESYAKKWAVKPETNCPYCEREFYPMSHKQIYCSRKCGNDSRIDESYFGGNRRQTIGLSEGICQMCGTKNPKGLSSHHMLGKENDPENAHLIALCQGCHHIVTIVAGRRFAATEEAWEVLIQLVLIRKNGHNKNFKGVFTAVEIDLITEENQHLYEDEE